MGSNFGTSNDAGQSAYAAFLSSAFMAAATQTTNTATMTDPGGFFGGFPTSSDADEFPPFTNTAGSSTGFTSEPVNTYTVTSETPTTLSTSTQSSNPTAPAESNGTQLATDQDSHNGGLSMGELAAAIVVPIVFIGFVALLAAFLLRRRRRKEERQRLGSSGGSDRSVSLWGLREKWGSMSSSASSQQKEPVVTNESNNAYMTGLDTSSHGGSQRQQYSGEYYAVGLGVERGSDEHPPPPYRVSAENGQRRPPSLPPLPRNLSIINLNDQDDADAARPTTPGVSHPAPTFLAPPTPGSPLSRSSTLRSEYFSSPSQARHLGTRDGPPLSSGRSVRSFTSDLYSETASVHSARAARMSIGAAAAVVNPSHRSSEGVDRRSEERRGDPFDDPESPISSLGEGERKI